MGCFTCIFKGNLSCVVISIICMRYRIWAICDPLIQNSAYEDFRIIVRVMSGDARSEGMFLLVARLIIMLCMRVYNARKFEFIQKLPTNLF